jgi:hypothetical protein
MPVGLISGFCHANQSPVRPKPDMTSSMMSKMP